MNPTLDTIKESILGELRHRVVRRKRDGTYWYVSERRGPHGDWLPRQVANQDGKQSSALLTFHLAIT